MVGSDVIERFQTDLLDWSMEHGRDFPWRDPDAGFYEVFMSEMFLRRTRADVVESFIPEFFAEYPDLESLREADQVELAGIIRPMGLQNKRAQGLLQLADEIDGPELPRTREQLLELPQVGPYVTNATLCFALDRPLAIVDRNVDRIYRRIFGDEWTTLDDEGKYKFAGRVLPEDEARRYNLALLDFASQICKAPEPHCERCFATGYCGYFQSEVM